ncbi:aminoglycoside phosphotransferase family protein [Streptomyces sp. IBSBF 2953]|nr:aminoglycoside phosphotransferase family protein [Streptomyces hayashii]
MSVAKPIPPALLEWAQSTVGQIRSVRDVSHKRINSRVWELTCSAGRVFVKVAPNPTFFSRETRALREVTPGLEPGTAPLLLTADPQQLALLVSSVPGQPPKSLSLTPADQRGLHRKAGSWLQRFHGGPADLTTNHHAAAAAEVTRAATGAEKHLQQAGDLISPEERRTVRWHAAELGRTGTLPVGFIHGDFLPIH